MGEMDGWMDRGMDGAVIDSVRDGWMDRGMKERVIEEDEREGGK